MTKTIQKILQNCYKPIKFAVAMQTQRKYTELVEAAIKRIDSVTGYPKSLFLPIHYTLELGGKRLRPVLMLAACDAVGMSPEKIMNQAIGIELFHNFTLMHDDIMDRSDLRRGHPTVYKKWGEAQAILSGDTMLSMATRYFLLSDTLADAKKVAVMKAYNAMAINVYRGQQLDMEFEKRDNVSVDEYIEMIGYKTSALLAGACFIGALAAGADKPMRDLFYEYGDFLGLAFQLQDDLLDSFGDEATFGKPIGRDILNDKKTWLNIMATTEAKKEMAAAVQLEGDAKVAAVKAIYEKLDLPARCNNLINKYLEKAVDSINSIDISEDARSFFIEFAYGLTGRKR